MFTRHRFTERIKAVSCAVVCSGFIFLPILASHSLWGTRAIKSNLNVGADSAQHPNNQPRLLSSYGHLPLSFEVNRGQAQAAVRFLARGSGFTVFLTDEGAVWALHKAPVEPEVSSSPPFRLGLFRSLLEENRPPTTGRACPEVRERGHPSGVAILESAQSFAGGRQSFRLLCEGKTHGPRA